MTPTTFIPPTPLFPSRRLRSSITLHPPYTPHCFSPLPTSIATPLPFPSTLPIPPPNFIPLPSSPSPPTIVWFRNDLRLHDHPALARALKTSNTPIPLFIFEPRHFTPGDFGVRKTGGHRAKFLIDAVEELKQSLQEIGSDLIVRVGQAEDVVIEVAREVGAGRVVCHREVAWEDVLVEQQVERGLEGVGVRFERVWGNFLIDVRDLWFGENTPASYVEFRLGVERGGGGTIRKALERPEYIAFADGLGVGNVPKVGELGGGEEGGVLGGEREGLRRLDQYVRGEVKELEFMVRIEPWLALGCVSAKKIWEELELVDELRKVNYYELLWRDFVRYSAARCCRERLQQEDVEGRRRIVREKRVVREKIAVLGFL